MDFMHLPGFDWRACTHDDLDQLHRLNADCALADRTPIMDVVAAYFAPAVRDGRSLCISRDGRIVAVAWLRATEEKQSLECGGLVHPDFRGQNLGTFLLWWQVMEGRAASVGWPRENRGLTLRAENLTDPAHALFVANGYRQTFAEHVMRRDLVTNPVEKVFAQPLDLSFAVWSSATTADFHTAYHKSFKERPGFPNPTSEEWQQNHADDPDFRADWSFVTLDGKTPVGFITCFVGEYGVAAIEKIGYIAQVGVIPQWRGRGLATMLIMRACDMFKKAGLSAALLDVNVNNPDALRLYRTLGFAPQAMRACYTKSLS